MPEHLHYDDDDLFNRETQHEHSDVPTKPLFWGIVIFVIFGVATHFLIIFTYKAFASLERKRGGPSLTAVQRPENEKVPAQPLLQPFPRQQESGEIIPPQRNTPVTDLVDMRMAEEQQLRNYGWVDKNKGVVRLPIQVAKDLIAQRGLPDRPAAADIQTPPATPAGAENAPQTPPAAATEGDPNAARIPAGAPRP